MPDHSLLFTSIIGGAIVYLNFYSDQKDKYIQIGKKLMALYNRTYSIHELSKTCNDSEIQKLESELTQINDELQNISIHKQVFFSNELAHFKLFEESRSNWFVNELKLTFWKDKIPAVWYIYTLVVILLSFLFLIINCGSLRKIIECSCGI